MHITVLGDSSSSGIGVGRACYPAKLAGMLGPGWDAHVFNSAVPGFTSADASRYFHDVAATRPLDYVVVYLGNNEGAVGPRKGYYSAFKTRLHELLSRVPDREFRPVLSPPRFRFSAAVPSHTVAVTPAQFRDNLRAIVRRAARRGAQSILINPVANRRFPSGVGAVNSTYFCHLDDLDCLGGSVDNDPTDEASRSLAAGLRSFAEGRFDEAIAAWTPVTPAPDVAGFIARHNVACAQVRQGDETAEFRLQALAGEYGAYDSTVLYNLAAAKTRRGDAAGAAVLLDSAYEQDASLYRIQREYRSVIADFAGEKDVRVVDLEPILSAAHFIDYCHPTEDGHETIARAIAQVIQAGPRPVGHASVSRYDVVFPTPDYLRQPGRSLGDYYCVDWPLDPGRIGAAVAAVMGGDEVPAGRGDDVIACVANFFRSNAEHPAFTGHLNLLGTWLPRSHEVLSFPEQFMYRVLYNYSVAFERDGVAARLSAGPSLEPTRLTAADYARIIVRSADDDLATPLDVTRAYFDAILAAVTRTLTAQVPMYRVTIGQRLRTVMTWFTREAFRYGTQSRLSMLYSRWDIEKVIEGLIVGVVIADRRGEHRAFGHLDGLLARVVALLQVHEFHVGRYHRESATFSVGDYEADLATAERSIKVYLAS